MLGRRWWKTQILSYGDVAAIPFKYDDLSMAKDWFTHLLISPDGRRFTSCTAEQFCLSPSLEYKSHMMCSLPQASAPCGPSKGRTDTRAGQWWHELSRGMRKMWLRGHDA